MPQIITTLWKGWNDKHDEAETDVKIIFQTF